jgi:hypothetical protein
MGKECQSQTKQTQEQQPQEGGINRPELQPPKLRLGSRVKVVIDGVDREVVVDSVAWGNILGDKQRMFLRSQGRLVGVVDTYLPDRRRGLRRPKSCANETVSPVSDSRSVSSCACQTRSSEASSNDPFTAC